jgi:hypothetical protein
LGHKNKFMDTDDLSIPTYKGILIEAEKFNHDLTLQFGLLATDCIDDDDYLNKAEALVKEWLSEDDILYLIEDIFFGKAVNEKVFKETLNKILSNIAEVKKTPLKQREFENWR